MLCIHMESVLGGRGAGYRFRRFEELCVEAFVVLRNEADHLMILLMLMVDSGIPSSRFEDVAWVHRALMVEERDDSKAAARFLGQVDSALDDRRPRKKHARVSPTVHRKCGRRAWFWIWWPGPPRRAASQEGGARACLARATRARRVVGPGRRRGRRSRCPAKRDLLLGVGQGPP